MAKPGSYSLVLQVEHAETKNQSRILKIEVLDSFDTEAEALAEMSALLVDITDEE